MIRARLRRVVRRPRAVRRLLREDLVRVERQVAVDLARGHVVEALHSRSARRLEQRLRAEHVRAEEARRIDDGERVVRLGGEVDDDLGPVVAQRRLRELPVADVALYERDAILDPREALAVPRIREQVVDDDLVVGVPLEPVVDEVRADEAGSAGDEEAHPRKASRPSRRGTPAARRASAAAEALPRARCAAPSRRASARTLELRGRDPPNAAVEPGLLEDRLGEVRPRAVTVRGDVPQPCRQVLVDELPHGGREVADEGRAAALVVDDGDLVALGAEPQHRPQEVVPRRAEEPGRPDHPRPLPGGSLAVELRPSVGATRVRPVRLDVRRALPAVEDVVRREVTSGAPSAAACGVPADVHGRRALRIRLRAVDVRPGRRVQHEIELAQRHRGGGR